MKKIGLFCISIYLGIYFLLSACSDNPPQIIDVEWQVNLFQNRLLGTSYQKLSVFVRATDKDGQNDLQSLHIINDEQELYWTLPSEKWEKASIRGSEWVGSNGITMPDLAPLPVGTYRVMIEDLSGKTALSALYMKKQNVDTADAEFPIVSIADGRVYASGAFNDPEIWIYDSNDQFLFRFTLPEKSIDIKTITSKNTNLAPGFSFYVYAKKNGVYYGVITGPYYYSP